MIYGNYLIVILGKNIAYLQLLAQTWWIRFRLSPIEVENSHRIKLKKTAIVRKYFTLFCQVETCSYIKLKLTLRAE